MDASCPASDADHYTSIRKLLDYFSTYVFYYYAIEKFKQPYSRDHWVFRLRPLSRFSKWIQNMSFLKLDLFPKCCVSYLFGNLDDGKSLEIQWFRVFYTTVRTLYNILTTGFPFSRFPIQDVIWIYLFFFSSGHSTAWCIATDWLLL